MPAPLDSQPCWELVGQKPLTNIIAHPSTTQNPPGNTCCECIHQAVGMACVLFTLNPSPGIQQAHQLYVIITLLIQYMPLAAAIPQT